MDVAAHTTTEVSGVEAARPRTGLSEATWQNVGAIITSVVLLIATLTVIYSLVLAIKWYNQPFLGAFASPTLVFNTTRSLFGTQAVPETSIQPGDRVLAINGISLDGIPNLGSKYNEILGGLNLGSTATVAVFRPSSSPATTQLPACSPTAGGANCTFTVPLERLPLNEFVAQFGIAFLTSLGMLLIGFIVWRLRRRQIPAQLLIGICATSAILIQGRFEAITTYQLWPIWILAICGLGVTLFVTANLFPHPWVLWGRQPRGRFVIAAVVFVLLYIAALASHQSANPQLSDLGQVIPLLVTSALGLVLVAVMYVRRRQSTSPRTREQASILLVSAIVAVLPGLVWSLAVLINVLTGWSGLIFSAVFAIPPTIIFPLGFAYAILQYRTLDSDRIISESLIYTGLGALLIVSYLLITTAVYIITSGAIPPNSPLLVGGTLFVIALAFTPMRVRLERLIDRSFFRQRMVYDKRLEEFARQLTTGVELNEIVKTVKQELDASIAPEYMFVFLRTPPSGDFEAALDPVTGKLPTDIRFKTDSGLVSVFSGETSVLRLEANDAPPTRLGADRARLAVLNTPLISRLRSARRMNGFLALGPRRGRLSYGPEELRYLEGVTNQSAAAFERAQMIIEAQQNERELRVLGQVSAALNYVMDFDTLLEFIYTQVDKVIRAPYFYIALKLPQNDELYYAFYQEQGERVPEKEGFRWAMGRDLISEIVRTQQPFKTENYVQETARRDSRLRIENPSLRAWMGVPLSAGDTNVLGCIAVSTTDPNVFYNDDQARLFWNIADLAATAIYKTRLFAEAEERARQMKALNDISSRLAAEFENLEALLKIITESAVEILRCEAGSLLLKDRETDDLIFTLAVGGSGQELVGRRIPAGNGIAGTVVKTGRHVIVNDTQQDSRWYGDIGRDSAAGSQFSTSAILAVPLTARGSVLGVLEVVNRKDGNRFGEDDVNLLTTFGSQAAVAIENAQLYQQTDQALAARVEQLDNMQRMDQELNRTLDLQRVADLTIDNALRESGAEAGALALVLNEPPGFFIVSSRGYPEHIFETGEVYEITYGILGKVYQTKQASVMTLDEMDSARFETLPGLQSQLAVPLITAANVSAVLLLETTRPNAFDMITSAYIQGFAEHANTAITNAQLFSRLQQANKARIDLLDVVAHELKNPMTSIKGYTEVLLGGMTGQLSDQQAGFVAIIRNNTVRMQQLVADLRDFVAQEGQRLSLKMGPVNFNNVVIETLRPQQKAIDDKDQKFILNVPETLPLVWGDELRLIQVMTNFVSNANKYTPVGGKITIMAEATANKWDAGGAAEVIHCTVSDTGIGMDDTDLKQLFTAYWRSDNPLAREQNGTGLGMTLTRGLIEQHGGKIWVDSTINEGTTFHFTVPLASSVEPVAEKVER